MKQCTAHSYHHAFPTDYSTGEFGIPLYDLTYFVDAMAAIGQAYNLKRTSESLINRYRQEAGTGHKALLS